MNPRDHGKISSPNWAKEADDRNPNLEEKFELSALAFQSDVMIG